MVNKEVKELDWEKEFNRVKNNSIYFLEMYFNKLQTNQKVDLSDEEKQKFFDQYRGVPYFGNTADAFEKVEKYQKRLDELREQGYKDWEIF